MTQQAWTHGVVFSSPCQIDGSPFCCIPFRIFSPSLAGSDFKHLWYNGHTQGSKYSIWMELEGHGTTNYIKLCITNFFNIGCNEVLFFKTVDRDKLSSHSSTFIPTLLPTDFAEGLLYIFITFTSVRRPPCFTTPPASCINTKQI